MSDDLVDDLRTLLASGQILVVVGAGVSIGATDQDPLASWAGLLHNGVDRAVQVTRGLPDHWADWQHGMIDSGHVDSMILAAEAVTAALGGPSAGEFGRWLLDTVGALKAKPGRDDALRALVALGAPIATTNYDNLLEDAAGLTAVTWRQGPQVQRVLRREKRAIIHLHGHYDDEASVVLGIRSYDSVLADDAAQAIQHAAGTLNRFSWSGAVRG